MSGNLQAGRPVVRDEVEMTFDARCQRCKTPIKIPLRRDWSSPLYVMHMEREHKVIREMLCQMKKDLIELAGECVDAGVRPAILRRADELRERMDELKRRFGIE